MDKKLAGGGIGAVVLGGTLSTTLGVAAPALIGVGVIAFLAALFAD